MSGHLSHGPGAPARPGAHRGTILLVDDEAEIVTALQDLFEDEYDVLATTSPADALRLLQREPDVSVILSDQRMPGMTGDQMLARAREFTHAEALLLTGYADLDAVVSALNKGRIAGYSPKPWDPVALRGLVGSAHERWALARALETERSLLHGLLDNSPGRLSFKDAQGRFVRLNVAKAESMGRSVAESLGRREQEFLPSEAAEALTRIEAEALHGRGSAEAVEEERQEGETRWFAVSRVPVIRQDAPAFLVTMEHEITERRNLEARLRQADKMQALGTMAGGVAHDFNNLLTAILGNLQLALRTAPEGSRQQRQLRNAIAAAERGSGLTQRLLSFSRQRDLDPRPVDANGLVQGMEDLLSRTLGGLIRIEHDLAPDLAPVLVDPGQLELALLNLCINARDAMPEGGVLTLGTARARAEAGDVPELKPGDYAVLSVRDTGAGMAPEVLSHAFEPFFTTKEVGKGTGLGLSMVYGLMRQSGGGIRLRSEPGQGTLVELFLPLSGRPGPEESHAGTTPLPRTRPLRILVVDDDPAVREVTATFLEELGHEILEAGDGPSALRTLETEEIDLMVADLAMPLMSGAELAATVKASHPRMPVLLVTGYAELDKLPKEYLLLHKPFRQADLARCIQELMEGQD
ncbi:response regulator [Roseomonas gilardii]|uniref:response regulator n=1 Tax=Roseomonas gilardii TaxID=257708 RepID=UPI000483EDDF|nr:response regulator [Roseomonas gilardii]SUE42552.1 Blue-light-activated protein [Roseomonas gilardii subsp. rosea]